MKFRRVHGLILTICLVLALSSAADAVKIVQPASGGSPGGAAGGDLGGTYPNPTVVSGAHLANGSVPSLAIAPVTGWQDGIGVFSNKTITANTYLLSAFLIPAPLTFSKITYRIGTSDGSNNSDICVWNSAGTLVANIGAQHIGSTGSITTASVQGSQTIPAGVYFVGGTSAASTLALSGASGSTSVAPIVLYVNNSYGTSSGGACATITPPALAPTWPNDAGATVLAPSFALN